MRIIRERYRILIGCIVVWKAVSMMAWLFFLRGILWGEKVRPNIRENGRKLKF